MRLHTTKSVIEVFQFKYFNLFKYPLIYTAYSKPPDLSFFLLYLFIPVTFCIVLKSVQIKKYNCKILPKHNLIPYGDKELKNNTVFIASHRIVVITFQKIDDKCDNKITFYIAFNILTETMVIY